MEFKQLKRKEVQGFLQGLQIIDFGAEEETRTLTPVRELDPESSHQI
jgi:hypothetical protein